MNEQLIPICNDTNVNINSDLKCDKEIGKTIRCAINWCGIIILTTVCLNTYSNSDLKNIVNQYLSNKLLA